MTSLTRTQLVTYLSIIFVAGAVSGGVLGWKQGRSKPATPVTIEKVCRSVEDRLKARLELTPEQMEFIQPILDHAAHKIKKAHARSLWDIEQILAWRSEEMTRHLSPGQVAKLEEFDNERRRVKDASSKETVAVEARQK